MYPQMLRHGARLSLVMCTLALVSCTLTGGPQSGVGQGAINGLLTESSALRSAGLASGEKLRVVATTNIVADVLANVAGDQVELTTLLPVGVDPHAFEPSPRDLRAVAEAHVVFINGLGLEQFLAGMLRNAGGRAAIVSLSEGISPLTLSGSEVGTGRQGGPDPHVWLDPNNVGIWTQNLGKALAALDPSRAGIFTENARRYLGRLNDLDAWIRTEVGAIPEPDRTLVTDHDELGYFAARYGFAVVGALVPAYSTAAEPSAQELSALEAAIQGLGIRAVFVGTGVNQALAQQVASDTGVRLVPLYTHSLSEPGGPAASYVSLMEYNVNAIVEALR